MAIIASQHVDCSDGIRAASTFLVIYGVPRSASSLTWQIFSDICGKRGVVRTHKLLDISPMIPVVLTVRDWRDCVVSCWRSQNANRLGNAMQVEEICQYTAIYQEYIWNLSQWQALCPKAPLLLYEDTIRDPGRLFKIGEQLGLPEITPSRKTEILAAHSTTVNRAVSDNQIAPDRQTLLQPQHLHEAESGTWKKFVDSEGAKLITQLLLPALQRYGYEPKPEPPKAAA